MDSYILHLRGTDIGKEGGLVKSPKTIALLKQSKEEEEVIQAKLLELCWDLPAMCRTVLQSELF
jgi:hypothetical protein